MVRTVILAAGEGSRLRPFTETIPKVMLPVANKPILEYVVNAVTDNGIEDITIVTGYKKERIMNHFGDGKHVDARITYETQDQQLGTGHALLQAQEYFNDDILVLPGDNIINADLLQPILNEDSNALLYIKHDKPSKYGVIQVNHHATQKIHEKPSADLGNLIATGIYKLNHDILSNLSQHVSKGSHKLTSFLQSQINQGTTITPIKGEGLWQDAVYPWDLLALNEHALHHHSSTTAGKIENNVELHGDIHIGKQTIIRSGTYIVGPVTIGKGCEIGPNTCIFPSTSIGNNVTIGPFTEIRNSILMDDTTIRSHAHVTHSVIGEGTTLHSHCTTTADDTHVKLNFIHPSSLDDQLFHTVENTGAFIGDHTRIGSGTTISPGVIIGKNCIIKPMNRLTENIMSRSVVA